MSQLTQQSSATGMEPPEMHPITSLAEIQDAASEFARGFDYNRYRLLHIALLKGDWDFARNFFDKHPDALTAKITTLAMTALQVVAVGGQWHLIETLVQLQRMSSEALAAQDLVGCTALHYVAMGGNVRAAKALVRGNRSLTQIPNLAGHTPLLLAIASAPCKELVWFLASATTDESPACPFSGPFSGYLVALLTAAGYHDITLHLLQKYPDLATISDENGSLILNVLSKMPSDFQSGSKLGFWESCIYHFVPVEIDHTPLNHKNGDLENPSVMSSKCRSHFGSLIWKPLDSLIPGVKSVRDTKYRHKSAVQLVEYVCSRALDRNDSQFWQSFINADILSNAAASGIVEIIRICFQFFPDLVWTYIPNEGYIVQVAIKNRQEKVLSLICKMSICKNFVLVVEPESKNTTSHLAAKLAPSPQLASISGTAFQMQKELQWFKEVEKLDHPLHKEVKNKDLKTPWQLFRDEHKGLLQQAEKWMKDTANSCMLVATLIATVVFAAVFTVPGGNDSDGQKKGIPIYLWENAFIVFAVSDVLALFSSLTSLLMFLSILAARYAEEDFLETLPRRLILGLASLFFAIATTMVAFGAAVYLVLRERFKWVSIPITLLASAPVVLFAMLQIPLFIQMIRSTYGSSIYHVLNLW